MSGGTGGGATINLNANTAGLRTQLQAASAQLAALRAQLAQLAATPSNTAAWQASVAALTTQARLASANLAALRAQIVANNAAMTGLGNNAALTGRKLSSLIDESVAGRWRQFDGTMASIVARIFEMNSGLGAAAVALGATAGAIAYLGYQWYEADKAQRTYVGGAAITGQLGSGTLGQMQSIISTLHGLGQSQGDIRAVVNAFAGLPPEAAKYSVQLAEIAAAQAKAMPSGEISKFATSLAKDWSEGAEGALRWANAIHTLDPTQQAEIEALAKGGQAQEAMNRILQDISPWVGQINSMTKARIAADQLTSSRRALSGGRVPQGDSPSSQLQPDQNTPRRSADEDEYTAAIMKGDTALQERKNALAEVTEAQLALKYAQGTNNPQSIAAAQDGVVAAERKLQEIHTASETAQYEATLNSLEKQLAAERDFPDQVAAIRAKMAKATDTYDGPDTRGANQADQEAVRAAQEAADARLRIKITELDGEMAAVANNKGAEIGFEDQKLAAIAAAGKQGTEQYVQEEARRAQLVREASNQEMETTIRNYRAQIEAAKGKVDQQIALEQKLQAVVSSYYGANSPEAASEAQHMVQLQLEQAAQEREIATETARFQVETAREAYREMIEAARGALEANKGKKASLLDLLGIDTTASDQIKLDLAQLANEFTATANAIKENMRTATNPAQTTADLDQLKLAWQKYNDQVTDLNRKAAQDIRSQWQATFNGINSSLNSSVAGMITGQKTGLQALQSVFTSVINAIVGAVLKIPEAWLEQSIESLFITRSSDATKLASSTLISTQQIAQNAAIAAAAAYAATAGIPIVGPELAPGAAATAYAGALSYEGLASYDVGTMNVPSDQIAQIHQGEMIIPETFASGIRSMMGGSGGGNSSSSDNRAFHYSPTYHGSGNTKQMADRSKADMYRTFMSWGANGATRLPGRG